MRDFLLIAGCSSKGLEQTLDADEFIGKFGRGFFTIFQNTKEVRIKTSNGNGKTTYVNFIPLNSNTKLCKDGDKVKDILIRIDNKDESFKGTEIQKVSNLEDQKVEVATYQKCHY